VLNTFLNLKLNRALFQVIKVCFW